MVRSTALLLGLSLLLVGMGWVPGATEDDPVLLVANENGDSLYFVDPGSGRATDSVSTGQGPHEVAAGPETRRAYVANYGGGIISVIDAEARKEVDRWPLPETRRPHGIAVGPDAERVYVTAEDRRAVLALDAASGDVDRVFETRKDGTHMLAVTSDRASLFATSIGSGTASKIDLDVGEVVAHTSTGDGAEGVAVTPSGGAVWVTNRADDTVSILDAESAAVVDSLYVTGFPIRVAFSPDGRHALVTAPRAGEVALFDAPERRPSACLDVGEKPIAVIVPTDARAYAADAGSGTVSAIDLETRSIVDTISVGRGPDGMAYLPADE